MSFLKLSAAELTACGLRQNQAETFVAAVAKLDQRMTPGQVWQWITRNLLRPEHPMEVHEHLQGVVFADWDPADGPAPAWFPEDPNSSNIAWLMRMAGEESYRDLHANRLCRGMARPSSSDGRTGQRYRGRPIFGSNTAASCRVAHGNRRKRASDACP